MLFIAQYIFQISQLLKFFKLNFSENIKSKIKMWWYAHDCKIHKIFSAHILIKLNLIVISFDLSCSYFSSTLYFFKCYEIIVQRDWKGWKITVNFHSMSLPIFNGDFLHRFFKIQSWTSHLNGHKKLFSIPIVSSHQFYMNSMTNGERTKREILSLEHTAAQK